MLGPASNREATGIWRHAELNLMGGRKLLKKARSIRNSSLPWWRGGAAA